MESVSKKDDTAIVLAEARQPALELEALPDETPLFRPDCRDCTFCDGLKDIEGPEEKLDDQSLLPLAPKATGGLIALETMNTPAGLMFVLQRYFGRYLSLTGEQLP